MNTAITGQRDDELPDPAPEPILAEPSTEPMPIPPPPPEHDIPDPAPARQTPRRAAAPLPTPRGRVYRVGGTIPEPRKLKYVSPVYPEIAKQARVSGVVILEATISPRGDVSSVTVLRGIPLLDQSAIDAVKEWKYTPTLLNGVPVPVIMTVTVNYKLQ
jgi:protein TonB